MPLQHNPQPTQTIAVGTPSINQVLSVAYAGGTPSVDSYTPTTFFDLKRDGYVAVSVLEVNPAGEVVAPAGGFTLGLYRSLDYGETFQLYTSWTANTETLVQMAITGCRWQFRLTTKGTNSVRVRALSTE